MDTILKVDNLEISFVNHKTRTLAVDGISFEINKGEILGLVGASGSGKSVSSYGLIRLLPQDARINNGSALFLGRDLLKLKEKELEAIRGKEIGVIFQDPMTALNPVYKIGRQLEEPLKLHTACSKEERYIRMVAMLDSVGIHDPKGCLKLYPHELSGGMRQRIMIAIALICEPSFVIADEPTTALDVTIQAQILELLKEIQQKRDLTILFITHDLGVVAGLCDRIIVMQAGKIVEQGCTEDIFYHPQHKYTKQLLCAVPRIDEGGFSYE